jgi:hypothetical protein
MSLASIFREGLRSHAFGQRGMSPGGGRSAFTPAKKIIGGHKEI